MKKPKPINPNKPLNIPKTINSILIALQGLYTDSSNTVNRLEKIESEFNDIKNLLVNILKFQKDLNDFEKKVFRDNLSK